VPGGIDHIVHAVHDLDAAAVLYRGLGFTVGARNRHPPAWGTHNHIVQFADVFVELLALADESAIAPHGERFFSFGTFNRDFLAHGQGLSMLVLEGRDSGAEAEAFRAAGIGDFALFDFQREAKRPDGTPTKVAFTLVYARDAEAPDIGYFTCKQHYPENFWNPAFQRHANGVTGVASVVLVADRPDDHRHFLRAFAGVGELSAAAGGGFAVKTPRGDIEVIDPKGFTERFGTAPPDTGRGARLAALRFTVPDLAAPRAIFQAAGIDFTDLTQRLVVGPERALGATLAFEGAG
jgi:hypothetical protein